MNTSRLFSLITLGVALSMPALAVTKQNTAKPVTKKLCEHFAPANDRQIPVGSINERTKGASGITKAQFNDAIKKITTVYAPIVKAQGATLIFNNKWTDATVNSDAYQEGSNWYVDAYGGLARYNSMTEDGMVFVFCHEMGHHLGGFPKFGGDDWASVEGQADYFAAMKCFRRVYQNDDNISIVAKTTIPKEVANGCSNEFTDPKDIALCERSSEVGMVLADVLWDLGKGGGEPANSPSFSTPSTDKVTSTEEDHPMAQCRLDTYFNGAICPVTYTEDFGVSDAQTGACSQEHKDKIGYRPVCWYAPSK